MWTIENATNPDTCARVKFCNCNKMSADINESVYVWTGPEVHQLERFARICYEVANKLLSCKRFSDVLQQLCCQQVVNNLLTILRLFSSYAFFTPAYTHVKV